MYGEAAFEMVRVLVWLNKTCGLAAFRVGSLEKGSDCTLQATQITQMHAY